MQDEAWPRRLAQLAAGNEVAELTAAVRAVEVRRNRWRPAWSTTEPIEADEWRLVLEAPAGEAWAIEGRIGDRGRPLGDSARLRRWEQAAGWGDAGKPATGATWAGRILQCAWEQEAQQREGASGVPDDPDRRGARTPQRANGRRGLRLRRREWTVANGNGRAERIRATEAQIRGEARQRTWQIGIDGSLWTSTGAGAGRTPSHGCKERPGSPDDRTATKTPTGGGHTYGDDGTC